MKFTVLSLFPEILESYFKSSIMAKAVERNLVSYDLVNIRDFATDKHKTCDDAPYGGGAGQLMMAEPLGAALENVKAYKKRVVYVTPSGRRFTQKIASELSHENELVFVCGRYEGIDSRIIEEFVDDEISIGDYVMSSGEVAAAVVIDSVYRLLPDVITAESLDEESFSEGLLEYPQYTRPAVYKDMAVPEILLSGNHEEIRKWRLRKRIEKTFAYRPDLIDEARRCGLLSLESEKIIEEVCGLCLKKHAPKNKRKRNSSN